MFGPGISGGPVNRIVKYTNLHINPVFGGRGKAPVNRGCGISGPGKSGFYCILVPLQSLQLTTNITFEFIYCLTSIMNMTLKTRVLSYKYNFDELIMFE